MSAQYLIRFDDLCPTMNRASWQRFEDLILRYGIAPILAVVPDNRDEELDCEDADAEFWGRMRRLEAAGAAIALHGYQHLCLAKGRSLVPIHSSGEFAGVDRGTQTMRIQAGLKILLGQGLAPRVWVAPRHGFDGTTLSVLAEAGIGIVSDGFAERPFRQGQATWLPQQLWAPVEKEQGLWTICFHSNSATEQHAQDFERFLIRNAERCTSVDRVLAEWTIQPRTVAMRLFHFRNIMRMRASRRSRRLLPFSPVEKAPISRGVTR